MQAHKVICATAASVFLVAAAPRSGGVPQLDMKETCKGSTPGDSRANQACQRDESAAKRELQGQWAKIPPRVRQSCLDEVKIGGSPSYVELLTCAQMDQWSKEEPNPTAPGAVRRGVTRP